MCASFTYTTIESICNTLNKSNRYHTIMFPELAVAELGSCASLRALTATVALNTFPVRWIRAYVVNTNVLLPPPPHHYRPHVNNGSNELCCVRSCLSYLPLSLRPVWGSASVRSFDVCSFGVLCCAVRRPSPVLFVDLVVAIAAVAVVVVVVVRSAASGVFSSAFWRLRLRLSPHPLCGRRQQGGTVAGPISRAGRLLNDQKAKRLLEVDTCMRSLILPVIANLTLCVSFRSS